MFTPTVVKTFCRVGSSARRGIAALLAFSLLAVIYPGLGYAQQTMNAQPLTSEGIALTAAELGPEWSQGGVATAAANDTYPYCTPGQVPTYVLGFKDLSDALGETMGAPIECEHSEAPTGDAHQATTQGLAFYRRATNTPTFTNGYEHWALTAAGLISWTGAGIDPPGVTAPTVVAAIPSTEAPSVPSPVPSQAPAAQAVPTESQRAPSQPSQSEVVAQVVRSVVQIRRPDGAGSGVKIAGGIITNEHVVRGASNLEVVASDGSHAKATVLRSDAKNDLALLSVDLSLPDLEVEPANKQHQGDPILVVGYPRPDVVDGQATVTRGIFSALRHMGDVTYVQTDAAVNPGSSGGAVVTERGKLIGIVEGKVSASEGLSIAISAETIQSFLSGPGGIAAPPATFDGDPRSIAIRTTDLGSGWYLVDDERKGYNNGVGYRASYLHGPSGHEDGVLEIQVFVAGDLAAAQAAWHRVWATPSKGWGMILMQPIGEDSTAQGNGPLVAVASRTRNVIVAAIGGSSTVKAQMDDIAPLVRLMLQRAEAQ